MRIVNTAFAALLVAALSIAYGFKERTKDLRRDAAQIAAQEEALRREIALLEFEWRQAVSPDRLARLAAALYGATGPVDADGVALAAWSPDQQLRLAPKRAEPEPATRVATSATGIITSSIPAVRAGEGAAR